MALTGLFLAIATLAPPLASPEDLDEVLVQHAGRRKPLEAFSREILWKTVGKQTWNQQPPTGTLLSLCFDPAWKQEKVLKAGHPDLAKALGGKRVSLDDLGSGAFETLWRAANRKAPSPLERAVLDLERRADLMTSVLSELRVLPDPKDPQAPWIGMGDPRASAASPKAYNAFVEMESSWRKGNRPAFEAASRDWAAALKAVAPADYSALEGPARLELAYHRLQPFRWSCLGYFVAFLLYLAAWVTRKPGPGRWALGFLTASFLLHGAGIAVRVAVAGRPPVSNMFEVILYVSWAVVAAAFVFQAVMKTGVAGLPAAGMACLGLLSPALFPFLEGTLNQPMPLDPAIGQVQAVLKSNYWLTVHVCTITTSYAILFLGSALGVTYLLSPRPELDRVAWKVNQLGFLFLTAGVLTGAWWANASWGRYWGWDPKETGAFIAWCVYGAYLHLRRFGFLQAKGSAWMSVLGFLAILFTMIGVSYFLPGLHSYA